MKIKYEPFSKKQRQIMNWWTYRSPVRDYDGIIADGAIRSGKTFSMALSFGLWSMDTFNNRDFIIAGKTIGSLRRNVINSWKKQMEARGYQVTDKRSENFIIIKRGKVENYYYLFGGKDESSQDIVQGMTAAGAYFDEAALMPESFVNQATSRCSVDGSKWWFNCNPSSPMHWFKRNWLDLCEEKNILHLHFTMDDNLTLSEKVKKRYFNQYVGVFFKRYILGLWIAAEGLIYQGYEKALEEAYNGEFHDYVISVDYGTQNAFAAMKWVKDSEGTWHCIEEYYYSGREKGTQKTNLDYAKDMDSFASDALNYPVEIIIDPSAASFIAELKRYENGDMFKVRKAKNDVIEGIQDTAVCIQTEKIKFSKKCEHLANEFAGYIWDEKKECDRPVKENDHLMDALRYFVRTKKIVKSDKKEYTSVFSRERNEHRWSN